MTDERNQKIEADERNQKLEELEEFLDGLQRAVEQLVIDVDFFQHDLREAWDTLAELEDELGEEEDD